MFLLQPTVKCIVRFNKDYQHMLSSVGSQQASVYGVSHFPSILITTPNTHPNTTLIPTQGSFLDFDWSDGDVVFANSTCFDDSLMADMSVQAERLKPGAFFVTFTKGLTSKKFEVLERKRYRMSWGPATGETWWWWWWMMILVVLVIIQYICSFTI
jgi:hypothetical protein